MTAPELEYVKLPMVCVCGKPGEPNLSKENADARREKAYAILSTERFPCTAEDFLSRAVAQLYFGFHADFTCAVDQWYGAYATVKKYVECEHKGYEKALDAGLKGPEADALDDCPDEPECFVYRWDDVLKVAVECDRLEDGLAELVIWFEENRSDDE